MTRALGDEAFGVVTAHHAGRVHRGGRDAVRDGRRERPARGDPRRAAVRWPARADWSGVRSRSRPRSRSRSASSRSCSAPWLAERFTALPEVAEPRVPRRGGHGAVRGARVHVHGRDPRAEDHAVHAVLAVDRAADRLDRPHARVLGGLEDGGDDDARVRRPRGRLALAIAWSAAGHGSSGGSSRRRAVGEGIPEEHTGALVRFGALRAPATLFSQLIFWTDLFVLSVLWSDEGPAGAAQVGVYGAVLRAGQSLFLFLTSVSLTFSPFVADLHHRGERERLDALYKKVTRWTLAATIPVLLVLGDPAGAGAADLRPGVREGEPALRILIVGMIVPVMVGTVGFILIMAGRTGWDLARLPGRVRDRRRRRRSRSRGPSRSGIRGAAIAQALDAHVLGGRPPAARPPVPRDLAVRRGLAAARGADALLGGARDGARRTRSMPERRVVARSARVGRARAARLRRGDAGRRAVADRARRRGQAHPSPAHGGGSRRRRSRRAVRSGSQIPRSVRSCRRSRRDRAPDRRVRRPRCVPHDEAT